MIPGVAFSLEKDASFLSILILPYHINVGSYISNHSYRTMYFLNPRSRSLAVSSTSSFLQTAKRR